MAAYKMNSMRDADAGNGLNRLLLACCVVTALLGTVTAFSQIIPGAIRPGLLAGMCLLWILMHVVAVGHAAVSLVSGLLHRQISPSVLLGTIGILTAILVSGTQYLARVVQDRPALLWNIDARFSLNHAQAISRSGGVGNALDYHGAAIDYHVGPAWLAASVEQVFSIGLTGVLIGVIPVFSILAVASGLIILLLNHGVASRMAVMVTGIVLTLPATRESLEKLFKLFSTLNHPDVGLWAFGPAMQPNAFFGMAVAIASLAVLLRAQGGIVALGVGVLGLSSLAAIKPQYYAGAGLLLGIYALGRLVIADSNGQRTPRHLLAALCSLAFSILMLKVLPGAGQVLLGPVWLPGRTGYSFYELMLLVLLIITVAVWRLAGTGAGCRESRWLLLVSGTALLLYSATIQLVQFPIVPELIERGSRIGIPPKFFAHASASGLGQGLAPVRLLVIASLMVLMLAAVTRLKSRAVRGVFSVAGLAVVLSPLLVVRSGLSHPIEGGYEAVEDVELYEILEKVPRRSELVIASDLADPAQDYKRAQRAVLMTAYHGHRFFVSNLSYGHYRQNDVAERLDELRAFFGSPWSQWHTMWLAKHGITHVLVHDRCNPVWIAERDIPLLSLSAGSHWKLYETAIDRPVDGGVEMPIWVDMEPAYGRAECLLAASLK